MVREQQILSQAAQELDGKPVEQILLWAVARYAPSISLATGFGLQSVALIHMLHELHLLDRVTVFYLETGLLFDETHNTRRELEKRYSFESLAVRPAMALDEQSESHGPELWTSNPTLCCQIRKIAPLRDYLSKQRAWITGLRRSQSQTRSTVPVAMWDEINDMAKINPMACMSENELEDYVKRNSVPYNPLRDVGYRSIGCVPCTCVSRAGEDERSGRWVGHAKTECGIHVDGRTVRNAGD